MQDLADQLIGARRSNDIANYLRIARYDMVEIARQICDIFVDWVAMNNVDFRINTQTPALGLDGPPQDGVRSAYAAVERFQKYVCLWESDARYFCCNENGKPTARWL